MKRSSKPYRGPVAPDVTRDPYMATITKIVMESGKSFSQIGRATGVSPSTPRNWVTGKTKRPCRVTVDFVLRACGHRLIVIPDFARPNVEVKPIKKYTWSPSDMQPAANPKRTRVWLGGFRETPKIERVANARS